MTQRFLGLVVEVGLKFTVTLFNFEALKTFSMMAREALRFELFLAGGAEVRRDRDAGGSHNKAIYNI
jgi:hypothetical protein